LRVLTHNLWGCRGEWDARREVLISGLRELRPDLIAFQEAVVTPAYDQVRDLLGADLHVVHQQRHEPDGQGISIASRWPIRAVHELDLQVTPRTADFACAAVMTEIDAPEPYGPLVFVNHLPNWQLSFERERELQAVITARAIEDLVGQQDRHVVLVGDFDADPRASSVRFWAGRQSLQDLSVCYRDAWESVHGAAAGHTFSPGNPLVRDQDWPFRRIDYIFVRCGLHGGPTLAISNCRRVFNEPLRSVWASDHFGVMADLAVVAHDSTAESARDGEQLALPHMPE
jgi:endonuclease/exonuclease/phosphatase family metal-dependent hydrolase